MSDVPDWQKKFVPSVRWDAPKKQQELAPKKLTGKETTERKPEIKTKAAAKIPVQKNLQARLTGEEQNKHKPEIQPKAAAKILVLPVRPQLVKKDVIEPAPTQKKNTPFSKDTAPLVQEQEVIEERKRPVSSRREGQAGPRPPSELPRAPLGPPPQHLLEENRMDSQPTAVKSTAVSSQRAPPPAAPKEAAQKPRRSLPLPMRYSGSSGGQGAATAGGPVPPRPPPAPDKAPSAKGDQASLTTKNYHAPIGKAVIVKEPAAARSAVFKPGDRIFEKTAFAKATVAKSPPASSDASPPIAPWRRNSNGPDASAKQTVSDSQILKEVEDRLFNSTLTHIDKSNIMAFKSHHQLNDTTELALKMLSRASLHKVLSVQVQKTTPKGEDVNTTVLDVVRVADSEVLHLVEEIKRIDESNSTGASSTPVKEESRTNETIGGATSSSSGGRKRIRLPPGNSLSGSSEVPERYERRENHRVPVGAPAVTLADSGRIRSRSIPFNRARSAVASHVSGRAEREEVIAPRSFGRSRSREKHGKEEKVPCTAGKAATLNPRYTIAKSAALPTAIPEAQQLPKPVPKAAARDRSRSRGRQEPSEKSRKQAGGSQAAAAVEEEFKQMLTKSIKESDQNGTLEQYLPALCREFSTVAQLKAVVSDEIGKSVLQRIEPALWEVLEVRTLGHKLLLAKAIIQVVST